MDTTPSAVLIVATLVALLAVISALGLHHVFDRLDRLEDRMEQVEP